MQELAIVNGRRVPLAEAALPLTDEGATRGDGAFETIGVWDGRPFRPDDHLQRLRASLESIGLAEPDLDEIRGHLEELTAGLGEVDAALRVYVTASQATAVTLLRQPKRPPARRLSPQPAPWIRPVGTYGPAGAKSMSYMPNMAAGRAARQAGYDDALLVSSEGWVLEGPTFCVLWARDGTIHAPTVELGIVDSISRRVLVELAARAGYNVIAGRWSLGDTQEADEVMVVSSIRPVIAVTQIGDVRFEGAHAVADELQALLDAARRARPEGR